MNFPKNLVLRCDASVAMGTGHVMRCLALAQAWQDAGGRAVFAMAETTPAIKDRLQQEGMEFAPLHSEAGGKQDAQATIELAKRKHASWVSIDGYHFNEEYQATLREMELKVLCVDDNGHAEHYSANIVLNQNAYARESLYASRERHTRLLLGPRFAMLRREFAPWRGWKREIPTFARKVLVTMGGSDPDNVTGRVLDVILTQQDFELTVVVGGSNPHVAKLRELAGRHPEAVCLVENVVDMPELLARADFAVAGAGTTSLEMSFLGLPALLMTLADNQRSVSEELSRRGVAIHVSEGTENEAALATHLVRLAGSAELRESMSERGRALVDGRGAERVVRALQSDEIEIRHAKSTDCRLLWELANDSTVRASAFSHQSIPWDDHVAWFQARLDANNCRILIAEAAEAFVGQVRFDQRSDFEADIDISVAREFREIGVSSRLIDLAVGEIFRLTRLARIHAYILPENLRSVRAFEKAGFRKIGQDTVKGNRAEHYVRQK